MIESDQVVDFVNAPSALFDFKGEPVASVRGPAPESEEEMVAAEEAFDDMAVAEVVEKAAPPEEFDAIDGDTATTAATSESSMGAGAPPVPPSPSAERVASMSYDLKAIEDDILSSETEAVATAPTQPLPPRIRDR